MQLCFDDEVARSLRRLGIVFCFVFVIGGGGGGWGIKFLKTPESMLV